MSRRLLSLVMLFVIMSASADAGKAQGAEDAAIRKAVETTIPALMAKDAIPGMAVGVALNGKSYVFNYGASSVNPRKPVTENTLFEIGSITKTFTATLAAQASVEHRLSLNDTVAWYFPDLRGTPIGSRTLLSLGTHTSGLPLQFPDDVVSDADLERYLENWRPAYPAGTARLYGNPGIGLLGMITAKSTHRDFRSLMEQQLFPALHLAHTYVALPVGAAVNYAWGYTSEGKRIRMVPSMLSDETFSVRSTAADMIRFLQEESDPSGLPATFRRAIEETHVRYYQAGPMTQDLIWEQYPYPTTLSALLAGNSPEMVFKPYPVRAVRSSNAPSPSVWLNKTGSTNGFGAYVAFVPAKRLAIVLLANKNYPIADRVTAAYRIFRVLGRPLMSAS